VSGGELCKQILNTLTDSVKHVDVVAINGSAMGNVFTLRPLQEGVKPMLKHELYLDEMNRINLRRGLALEFVVAS
jgi:hypothetical protein